jgi:acyl-coenzyme A synthetase/AMP-(fatty) acid ligase
VTLRHRLVLDDTAPGFLSFDAEMARPGPAVPPPEISEDTQAFQPYTSGSTGRPKGAIMTHRGMLWYVAHNQQHWPASTDDRGLVALPLFHKNALRGTVKPMLYAGGSFVLMPAYEPRAYLEALAKYRCTYSRGVAAAAASRRPRLARPQCAAQPVDRFGSGDAGIARRRRARTAGREDIGKLRPHRRRQPLPCSDRRAAGAAR